jgi:hypothetical protein
VEKLISLLFSKGTIHVNVTDEYIRTTNCTTRPSELPRSLQVPRKDACLVRKAREGEAWTSYIKVLREQNRNLRALKEELAAAGL